jgi:hypothetical protein
MYLADRGFDARLIYYVQRTSTLENVALVATRHQKPNVIDDGQQRLVDVAQSDVM